MPQESLPVATSRPINLSDSHFSLAHLLEQDIRRELMSHDEWTFHSLVVHRFSEGVCLQGVVECNRDDESTTDEIERLVRQIAGVDRVINQLILQKRCAKEPPLKG